MIDQYLRLFECLNRHDVEYLLIGGVLVIAYGMPRYTKDADIFLRPTLENSQRCMAALHEIPLGTAHLTTVDQLMTTEVTIFKDVFRLAILTKVKGIEFADVWQRRVHLAFRHIMIPALHIDDLIASKRAAGRATDLHDITVLEMSKTYQKSR